MQADPFIQAPMNSQSYNRYSYVLNNPLSYTDPSGYFFKKLWNKTVGSVLRAIAKVPILNTVAQAAACFYGGPWGCAAYASASTYAVTGSLRAAFTSGAIAFASAHAFQKIGNHFKTKGILNESSNRWGFSLSGEKLHSFGGKLLTAGQISEQIAAHAVVGGITSELAGGKFGHGFFSAGVTKGLGGTFLPSGSNLSTGEVVGGTVVSAVIGGTASAISGGKFVNGAETASFQYMFNQVWGFSIGGSYTTKKGKVSGFSLTVALDGNGDFSILYTPEAGVGVGKGFSPFLRGILGLEDNYYHNVDALAGPGVSSSFGAGPISASATLPYLYQPFDGSEFPYGRHGINYPIFEVGVGRGAGGSVTYGHGIPVYQSDIFGRIGRPIGDFIFDITH
uniref:hypothetical protein n=1 Tax=Alteromonas lipotrueae TaxID=2803814 RepID=UPI0035A5BEC0